MQHFKHLYNDDTYHNTFSNIQKCLRLNDWNEIGDSTHYLTFDMIGLFSFQEWTLKQSINFIWYFLAKINITPDYVTIHPDKIKEWSNLYFDLNVEIRMDDECIWSDGNVSGYCTEFYKNDIEIGNIVNTLGRSIDIGFGLERLLQIINQDSNNVCKLDVLEDAYFQLTKDGVEIGNKKQGYLLKKIIIESILLGSLVNDYNYNNIRKNIINNYRNYLSKKRLHKFKDKDSSFWLDTFGIDEKRLDLYQKIKHIS